MPNENTDKVDENVEVDVDKLKQDVNEALKNEDAPVDEEVKTPEPEYTDSQKRAMELGWNPDPESLEGTDKEWVDDKEFLRNQHWVDEIKKVKRQLRKTAKIADAFKEQNLIASQKGYEKAIKDLKQQKLKAAEEEDISRMLQIDEQISEVEEEKQQEQATLKATFTKEEWDTAFEDFVEDNSWYSDNIKMRAVADSVGYTYATEHPGSSPEEVYAHVTKRVADEFKEETPAKPTTPKVTTPPKRTSTTNKAKHGISDIPEEHRSIAMTLIKSKAISEEDYLKQYFPEDYS